MEFIQRIETTCGHLVAWFEKIFKGDIEIADVAKMVVFILAIAVLALTWAWRWWIAIIGLFIWACMPVKASLPWARVTANAIVGVVNENHVRLNLQPVPSDEVEAIVTESVVTPDGVKVATIQLEKSKQGLDSSSSEEEAAIVRLNFQTKLNKKLRRGLISGIPFASLDGRIPVIYLLSVQDLGTHFAFKIVFVDNAVAVKFVMDERRVPYKNEVPKDEMF